MRTYILLIIGLIGLSQPGVGRAMPDNSLPTDSIVVLFGKNTRIVIHSTDKNEIRKLQDYNFNQLLDQVMTLMDSSVAGGSRDTSWVVNGDSVIIQGNRVIIKEGRADDDVTVTIRVKRRSHDERSRSDTTITVRKRRFKRTSAEFMLDLGLNNYLANGQIPGDAEQPYPVRALRPWGSRYGALSFVYKTRIGNRKSPLLLTYGLEFAANNFMFESNDRIRRGANGIFFEDTGRDLKKTKLTVLYLSLPVMPMLDFRTSRGPDFRVGLGGFVGYRLSSYSKIVYFIDGDKEKEYERNSFDLTDVRYGLMGQIGYKGLSLFVKYDLNPLFKAEKGPDLNALSFGVRL